MSTVCYFSFKCLINIYNCNYTTYSHTTSGLRRSFFLSYVHGAR